MNSMDLKTRRRRAAAGRRWPLNRIVGAAVLALLLFSVAVVVVGEIALASAHDTSKPLDGVFIALAVGLLFTVLLLALGLRAAVIRPLDQLAAQARRVADGDFEHEVTVRGPREVTNLAADVNTMRERILQELSATRDANAILQAHTAELQRSKSRPWSPATRRSPRPGPTWPSRSRKPAPPSRPAICRWSWPSCPCSSRCSRTCSATR
jgi:HAMP domain-containing protein